MGRNLDGYDFAAKGNGNAASNPPLPVVCAASPTRYGGPFPA